MSTRIKSTTVELHSGFEPYPEINIELVEDGNPDAGLRIEITQYWSDSNCAVWVPVAAIDELLVAIACIRPTTKKTRTTARKQTRKRAR